jgi:hypothetical protein
MNKKCKNSDNIFPHFDSSSRFPSVFLIGHLLFLIVVLFFTSFKVVGQTPELEIHSSPEKQIYLFETNSRRDYYNVLIHNLICINRSSYNINIEKGIIELVKDNQTVQTVAISRDELASTAQRIKQLEQSGVLKLYDPFLRISQVMKDTDHLSPNLQLAPNEAIVSMWHYLTFKGIPQLVKICFIGEREDGKQVESHSRLKLIKYEQANSYIFPVKGAWFVAVSGDASTAHRWVLLEEFALDLGQVDIKGKTYRKSGLTVEDYYCFNQDVVAVADGEVVFIQNGLPDDNTILKKMDESDEAYSARLAMVQLKFLKENPYHAAGNYIVLRHSGNEYSHYAHLKQGSIKIKKGDQVKQGQVIGAVGHSGNSTEPHLHFSINDGVDFLTSVSLPVTFSNIKTFEREAQIYPHSGDIVQTKEIQQNQTK